MTPIFKKDDATCVKNYRPVSVLPSVSKVFERLMQDEMISYIEIFYHHIYVATAKDLAHKQL